MLLTPEHTRATFRKLARQMSKLADKPAPENVHKFRTSSRRVEVLVSDLAESRSGNDKKLLKLLGRLRKKAGRVRDLDVQSAALRSLKIPQEPGRKSQLMRTLAEERDQREKKLAEVAGQADRRRSAQAPEAERGQPGDSEKRRPVEAGPARAERSGSRSGCGHRKNPAPVQDCRKAGTLYRGTRRQGSPTPPA